MHVIINFLNIQVIRKKTKNAHVHVTLFLRGHDIHTTLTV